MGHGFHSKLVDYGLRSSVVCAPWTRDYSANMNLGITLWLSLQRSYSVTVRFKYSPMLPRKSEEPNSGGKTGPLNRECQLLPFTCSGFPTCISAGKTAELVLYCHCCWSYSQKRTPEWHNFPPVLLAIFPWLHIDIHTYI